jgi:phosphoenolpyruvate synthase/pyruvate phosphate dikinase
MPKNRIILPFRSLGAKDVALAGGKGASLGEMTRAGIPVPSGFVILASVFEKFLKETNLNVEIEAILDSVDHKEIHTVENASEKIEALILGVEMPDDIAKEIQRFFNNLNSKYVAVRSSATAEDSTSAAWAGQLESYLNTTEENLLENIKKCWASLFTPRAIVYRFEKSLHKQIISVAVVVQEMIESEVAGIAFSVHPVTQDEDQLVIEAGFGLGEAIVGGEITPDSYVIAKAERKILDINIGEQQKKLVRGSNSANEWKDIARTLAKTQKLTDRQIIELGEIVLKIENHYKFPVDVEWAFENNAFHVVQSRPITTLQRNIQVKKEVESKVKWYKLLAREGVDITTISQIDVVFYDLIWQATKNKSEVFFTILSDRNFTHYIGADQKEVGRFAYRKYFNDSKQIIKYYRDGKRILKTIKRDTTKWAERLSKNPTKNNFLSAFKNFKAGFEKISYIYSIISWLGIEAWQADFEQVLNELIVKNHLEKQTETILSTVYKPWKKTGLIEIQEKLALGKDPKQLADEYQFLRSWSVVWYKPITEDWVKSIYNSSQKVKPTIYSSAKLLKLLKPDKLQKKFLDIAPYIVFFKDWRDDARRFQAYHWSFFFDLLGQKFNVERDNIGYLTLNEMEKILRTEKLDSNIIKKRKEGCVITLAEKGLSIRVLDGVPPRYEDIAREVEQREQEKVVRGKIAQMGIVRGTVKVLRSYHDIKRVQEGDILVANTTHPNYLPAMQKAAAFVTNEGGMISHASIIARELRRPCIVGTSNATKVLMDGDFVEVNADIGIVRLLRR